MGQSRVNLSENSFLGALLIVTSSIGSIIGVAALFVKDPTTLVGIAAGAAWTLSLCLLVMNARQRRYIARLEDQLNSFQIELDAARGQADQWSITANNVSQASMIVLQMIPSGQNPPPRLSPETAPVADKSVPKEAQLESII